MNKRNMGVDWALPAQRFNDLRLAKSVGEMIIAANDMRDTHVVIIDDDGQIIGGRAVGAGQHQIIKLSVVDADAALHLVVNDGGAFLWRTKTDNRGNVFGRL